MVPFKTENKEGTYKYSKGLNVISYRDSSLNGYFIPAKMFSSLFESKVNEAKVELDTFDFEAKELQRYLKKEGIKAKLVDPHGGGGGAPVYVYSADRATLKKMLDNFWLEGDHGENAKEWYDLIESKGFASKKINEASLKIEYSLEDFSKYAEESGIEDEVKLAADIARMLRGKADKIGVFTSEDDNEEGYDTLEAAFNAAGDGKAFNNTTGDYTTWYSKKANIVKSNDGSAIAYFANA
jgi:hypothetical protein